MTTLLRTDPSPFLQALHGHCRRCNREHRLSVGKAPSHCAELMLQLISSGSLEPEPLSSSPSHSTLPLFGEERGKMFGVLEGIDARGSRVILRAFSGQYNGLWNISGWAPPLFDERIWLEMNTGTERIIKNLSALIDRTSDENDRLASLRRRRRLLSRELMEGLHKLYRLRNFRGETAALGDFFTDRRGAPTGAGDCCAPKLLNAAIAGNIVPLGIAEFYWGRTSRSKEKVHGRFYPACADKCMPLMGFLLCGLEERQRHLFS